MTDTETSFARANRLADEAKARKRLEYDTGPKAWRAFDWSDYDQPDTVSRPVEVHVLKSLHYQTTIVSKPDVQDNDKSSRLRRSLIDLMALHELMAAQNTTLLWWDEQQQRLTQRPTTRGKVDAVIVPLKRKVA